MMKRERFFTTMISVLLLFLFFVMVLLLMERGVSFAMLVMEKRERLKAQEFLADVNDSLAGQLGKEALLGAEEIFQDINDEMKRDGEKPEEQAEEAFYDAYEAFVQKRFGDSEQTAQEIIHDVSRLDQNASASGKQSLQAIRLANGCRPVLKLSYTPSHMLKECVLENVALQYYKDFSLMAEENFDLSIPVPGVQFYSGNDTIFGFAMLAGKGIYMTGRTSSVMGDIYAGTHPVEEYRQAELRYGEKGSFGGINILATQLGVEADTIITTGNINVKDSFVLFGLEDKPVTIYADAINRPAGFESLRQVTVYGETVFDRNDPAYLSLLSEIESGMSRLSELYDYYDSDNDRSYTGSCRKILSNYDIILSRDFVGAAVTSGNVIVESGVNVEGIIIAGDRIYVQGNNNIVSNEELLRTLIDEEYEKGQQESGKEEDEFAVSHDMKDYIGDIRFRGIETEKLD
ncbi:MAG: hypothetical protein K6G83_16685 [Lachnospiraceae bacterium]|nr:hypothetical protein [Lachnospiraceae bacterium]